MRYNYNAVMFLQILNKRQPIARPLGGGMGVFCGPKQLDIYSE